MALELPKKYLSPKLMVVGDSLAQGCRSLTVKKEFCAQSYGAVLAASQGWSFSPPTHPQPVVGDVEDIIRKSNNLLTYFKLSKLVDDNLKAWKASFASPAKGTPPCWDNLAIAGCNTEEFRSFTAKTWRKQHDKLTADYAAKKGFAKLGVAANMHFPINGQYTLNPTGDSAFDDLTQLQWAFARKPQNLIVHFGHNDGLYPVGSSGELSDLRPSKKAYLDTIKEVLAAPKEIQHLVIILLPKVSCVANLMPQGGLLPGSTYFESYETQFPFKQAISGKNLETVDKQISEINGEARVLIGKQMGERRITIVDAYKVFGEFDYKNTTNIKAIIRIGSTAVDNRYLEGRRLPPAPHGVITKPQFDFRFGGFQSIDGMHPTAVGYAVFADQIALAMNLPRPPDVRAKQLKEALKNEKLITNFPSPLPPFQNLLNFAKSISKLLPNKEPDKTEGKQTAQVTVGAMAVKFCRE